MPLLDSKTLGPARLGFADEKDLDAFISTLGQFERGEISPDAWKAFRLVNGVYSQRQEGDAMMVRVKIPQGVLTPAQLRALATVGERFSIGRGHLTTRQHALCRGGDAPPAARPAVRVAAAEVQDRLRRMLRLRLRGRLLQRRRLPHPHARREARLPRDAR